MIVTLCGSAKFENHFHAWNEALSYAGHLVFSLCAFPSVKGEKVWYDDKIKEKLDMVHLHKISASDAIVLLNVGGYVGESARREAEFAKMLGKKVYALESWGKDVVTPGGITITYPTSSGFGYAFDLAYMQSGYDPRKLLEKK